MTYEEYKAEAIKTMNPNMTKEEVVDYCSLKLMEEAGELLGSYAKQKYHKAIGNDVEELGDLMWYIANIDNAIEDQQLSSLIKETTESRSTAKKDVDTLTNRIEIYRSALIIGEAKKHVTSNWSRYRNQSIVIMLNNILAITESLEETLMMVMVLNIDKLRKRHGEQYNAKHYQKA